MRFTDLLGLRIHPDSLPPNCCAQTRRLGTSVRTEIWLWSEGWDVPCGPRTAKGSLGSGESGTSWHQNRFTQVQVSTSVWSLSDSLPPEAGQTSSKPDRSEKTHIRTVCKPKDGPNDEDLLVMGSNIGMSPLWSSIRNSTNLTNTFAVLLLVHVQGDYKVVWEGRPQRLNLLMRSDPQDYSKSVHELFCVVNLLYLIRQIINYGILFPRLGRDQMNSGWWRMEGLWKLEHVFLVGVLKNCIKEHFFSGSGFGILGDLRPNQEQDQILNLWRDGLKIWKKSHWKALRIPQGIGVWLNIGVVSRD